MSEMQESVCTGEQNEPRDKTIEQASHHMENFSSSPKQCHRFWNVMGWPVMFPELYSNAVWESIRYVTMGLCPVLSEFTSTQFMYVPQEATFLVYPSADSVFTEPQKKFRVLMLRSVCPKVLYPSVPPAHDTKCSYPAKSNIPIPISHSE